jgi:hypothetical protein
VSAHAIDPNASPRDSGQSMVFLLAKKIRLPKLVKLFFEKLRVSKIQVFSRFAVALLNRRSEASTN